MGEGKEQERSFELRSDKVRSIVGQIPSSLVRYGITAIGTILICLFAVAYFLPYKQIYSGTAFIRSINPAPLSDSIETVLLLKFCTKRLEKEIDNEELQLQTPNNIISGKILWLSSLRDTLERQEALCRFQLNEIILIEHQAVDFFIVESSGTLLQKMIAHRE